MKFILFIITNLFFHFSASADIINVRVAPIKISSLYEVYNALGMLNKSQSEDYFANVGGKITYVNYENNGDVKENQLIMSIDGAYANSILDSAKQAKVKAENDYNNNSKLFDQQLVSKQNLQLSKSLYYKALSDYQSAQKEYIKSVFKAPFDGTIGSIKQKVGDNVKSGDFLFSIIGKSKNAVINFDLASFLIDKITNDSKVWIENNNNKVFGKVIAISPYLSKENGNFTVKVIFENSKDLVQNKYYNASFIYNIHDGFCIPENSLLSSEKGNFIYIVSDNIVKQINVKIGTRLEGLVEIITDEVKSGDLVITEGLNKVFIGSQVKIIE